MECAGDDLFCQVATWVSENEFVASYLAEGLGRLGATAGGIINQIALFVRDHAQTLIGAFGLTFGIWRWWKYRELILHKRLTEYISESDKRLEELETDLLKAMFRPGPGRALQQPLFASAELRSVLRERNWDSAPQALTVQQSADLQLAGVISKLERQMSSAQQCKASLERQSATAHLVRGAIASIATRSLTSRDANLQSDALEYFREALKLDSRNVLAKELEAHQLRKLGHFDQALVAFSELEKLARKIDDVRSRDITIARSKRYRAEIQQFRDCVIGDNGETVYPKKRGANDLLSQGVANSALALRASHEPFHGWDLLEHADTFFVAAFVSHNLGNTGMAVTHLAGAKKAYERLVSQSGFRAAIGGRRYRRLRRLASDGLKRVIHAQESNVYDLSWLR